MGENICIVVIFGDGIGLEVVGEVVCCLEILCLKYGLVVEWICFFWLFYVWYEEYGEFMLEDVLK